MYLAVVISVPLLGSMVLARLGLPMGDGDTAAAHRPR
jgi:hypothetical protein